MLYGFRSELQVEIANSGYNFCTYVPYGEDWYGYFMRRLAERPQNLQLVYKSIVTPQVERGAIVAGSALAGLVVLRKLLKK